MGDDKREVGPVKIDLTDELAGYPDLLPEPPHCSHCGVRLFCNGSDVEHESALKAELASLTKTARTVLQSLDNEWPNNREAIRELRKLLK